MTVADQQLVAAACGGDAAAVERLLVVCQPDLRRFARRACSSREDAEEAVQIALWQLYRKIGALKTAAAFASWLFKIVERECYRLLRARGPLESIDAALDGVLRQEPLPLELRRDLSAAISALPEPYRTVLVLRDIDELSAAEVAAELAVSQDAVKSRLHRARAMVRERLLAGGYLAAATGNQE
jgi:RNA polymerase sigma factor (sigma-70 family)